MGEQGKKGQGYRVKGAGYRVKGAEERCLVAGV
jgi:hypothetical protein